MKMAEMCPRRGLREVRFVVWMEGRGKGVEGERERNVGSKMSPSMNGTGNV